MDWQGKGERRYKKMNLTAVGMWKPAMENPDGFTTACYHIPTAAYARLRKTATWPKTYFY